jgi:hypothetical protein
MSKHPEQLGQSMDEAAADNFGLTIDDLGEDSDCPTCGGEGFTFDCFDGCGADADMGCDDCIRPCECQRQKKPRPAQESVS